MKKEAVGPELRFQVAKRLSGIVSPPFPTSWGRANGVVGYPTFHSSAGLVLNSSPSIIFVSFFATEPAGGFTYFASYSIVTRWWVSSCLRGPARGSTYNVTRWWVYVSSLESNIVWPRVWLKPWSYSWLYRNLSCTFVAPILNRKSRIVSSVSSSR